MENTKRTYAGLGVAIRAALEAGSEIMRIYTDPSRDFGVETKADNSPLTLADKASHLCIASYLGETGLPVLSEEGADVPYEVRRVWDAFWLVDPLDGTKEFIKRNGEFTVNIALVLNGRPHLGVIYAPVRQELYFGEPLLGAHKVESIAEWTADMSLPVLLERSHRLPAEKAKGRPFVVVSSRTHSTPETQTYIEEARRTHTKVKTMPIGSSLKICLVAAGVADVYPRFGTTMEWDTGAGHAIACCAGKQIYQAGTQKPLDYNKEDLRNPWFVVE